MLRTATATAISFVCIGCNTQESQAFSLNPALAPKPAPMQYLSFQRSGTMAKTSTSLNGVSSASMVNVGHVAGCSCPSCVNGHSESCSCARCRAPHDVGCSCVNCRVESHSTDCSCGNCAGSHSPGCVCSDCIAGHGVSCNCAGCRVPT